MADVSPVASPVTFKKRSAKSNARRRATSPTATKPDSDDSGSDNERIVKRRKTNGKLIGSTTNDQKPTGSFTESASAFTSDRTSTIVANDDATKHSNWYEEDGTKESASTTDTSTSQNLLGTSKNKPKSFLREPANPPPKFAGPMKAATNVRTITITDFAPDVCKDYKKTGFCGFGDSCKYLHQREDYAAGHKLDDEWNKKTKEEREGGKIVASANRDAGEAKPLVDSEDALLLASQQPCIFCNGTLRNPVELSCKHAACEDCAIGAKGALSVAKKLHKSVYCPLHKDKIEYKASYLNKLRKFMAKQKEAALDQ